MLILREIKTLSLFAILAGTSVAASAQTYRLPDAHTATHNDLIA